MGISRCKYWSQYSVNFRYYLCICFWWRIKKIDNNGVLQWTTSYNIIDIFSDYDGNLGCMDFGISCKYLEKTNDNGFIIGGVSWDCWGGQFNNTFILKTDSLGILEWVENYGTNYNGPNISSFEISNIGFLYSINNEIIIHRDFDGNLMWDEYMDYSFNDITQSDDNFFLILGNNLNNYNLLKTYLPYTFELINEGCDSVQDFVSNDYIYESQNLIDTLINQFGGDSIIIQEVVVSSSPIIGNFIGNPYGFTSFSETYYYEFVFGQDNTVLSDNWIVDGGNIQFIYGNGIDVLWGNEGIGTIDWILTDTITGCFSTFQFEVNISNPPLGYLLTGCDSVFSEINNVYVYESGPIYDTLINQFGGDSIIFEGITIFDSPSEFIINGNIDVISLTIEYYEIDGGYNNPILWNVEGGTIFENNNNTIQVLWGDEGIGYVEVTETDTNGCSTTSTLEVTISNEPTNIYEYNTTRKLIKTINLLGQEIKPQKNQSYIEIYDDGTRKRKIIIE